MRGFRLAHRLAVFAVAVVCVIISLESLSTAILIMRGKVSRNLPLETFTANLITAYAGTTTIKASPLVQQVLDGSTSPKTYSVYLETPSAQSHTGCSNVPNYNRELYNNEFLRFIFSRMQTYAAYNMSYLAEMELVVPVVDCTFDFLVLGYPMVLKVYYLVRNKTDPEQVLLLSTSLSAQDYQVAQQFQKGAATILLVAAINETQATTVNHLIAVALNYPPIVFMLAYVVGRKSTREARVPAVMTGDQDKMAVRRRSSAYRKGSQNLTSFELATGAALTNRFGVISSYDNYEVHDNQLTATIDAVYCNGFLVVNGKFLIGAQDLLPLIVMKLTRVRFTNIFVHEMEKNAVKETSMLVYPTTIAWSDLLHLDVTMLT
ncbi:putative transmembrane protein [Phytophthora cinnamomi]|uniref:putative transmembrane protein n=1 Tax=Phytophthora cinnamomi TaxID=4785 RepID=UPI00355A612A|nr:putative transmembrane protein [Phytophthora cinnamomi]